MKNTYFSDLLPELAIRASRATIGRLGFSNPALRAHLNDVFSKQLGSDGCYLGEPVFEATFGWESADCTMGSLAGSLLSDELVAVMDAPGGKAGGEYRFPRTAAPYRHQLEAWTVLSKEEPRSVVVTSGTGSGKTECFMVPILDSLVRECRNQESELAGVRALFLYPLNALIQSQQERLRAWTEGFSGDVRFCLYNGNTPEKLPKHKKDQVKNQVLDRETLRSSPPPILVTNATMLEYMLVRAQDTPILKASQGKLQWIVLDEAHTYIGSQAAELALLLRRVLHAFAVRAEDVRFVATSATIGGEQARSQLQEYLAKVAGISADRVHVVDGRRKIPELSSGNAKLASASLETLENEFSNSSTNIYEALSGNSTARRLRQLFESEKGRARQLKEIVATLVGEDRPITHESQKLALRWLDLLTRARSDVKATKGAPFLPLRLHAFHNVMAGLWACADPACTHKTGTALDSPNWSYGKVYLEERRHCECGSPVYEVRSCNDCNTTYLMARQSRDSAMRDYKLTQFVNEISDEFVLDVEHPDEEEDESEDASHDSIVLITNSHPTRASKIAVDRQTLTIGTPDPARSLELFGREATTVNEEGDIALVCPECDGHKGDGMQFFRRAILGAPFLLSEIIPTLLEFCPDIDDKENKPLERPCRGRRMITFTDSRQGTARIAAKLQQDAERNSVRGMIYRRMLSAGAAASEAQAEKLRSDLAELMPHRALQPVAKIIEEKERELQELSSPKPVPWIDIADWLVTNESDVRDWMYDRYVDLDPREFGLSSGRSTLGRILVMREFARRPKRLNSLETMGLVACGYPKLKAVIQRPEFVASNTNLSTSEWRDFLKIALDFHVRENTFIDLPEGAWRKWGGNRLSRKWMLPPQSTEKQTNQYKRWPQCNVAGIQSRLVRLLAYVIKLDPTSERGRDVIDGVLRCAWDTLVSVGLFDGNNNGRFLKLEDIALSPMTKGWICPVTRRVLDVTLRGITPYLPREKLSTKSAECREVLIPLCTPALSDYSSPEQRLAAIRTWLNADDSVSLLRTEGLWSDLNDRVVEGTAYFRAAEHSAQQSGLKLEAYERDFKSGRINLLSCSTTMEMGVDIGGISVVAMNNVPPHPANYLQRAGRAGRRSETRSLALTVCKNNPHDQHVLRDPLWAFNTQLAAPAVMLSSSLIVQRHLNSMLLAHFLRKDLQGHGSAEKLDMRWWMLPLGDAPVDRFCAWANCFISESEPSLTIGLRSLLRHTCYEGVDGFRGLSECTAEMVRNHAKSWLHEYQSVEEQLTGFTGADREKQPAYRALRIQLDRLTGEYLLRELASSGVLPGYSFPTNIASLDTLTCEEIEREKDRKNSGQGRASRDDNAYRRRELPSRDTVTALREYAPGADVVIDGLVYRSSGVTLNWHVPASVSAVAEIQNIRQAWRCRSCGSSGTAVLSEMLTHCPDCGSTLASDEQSRFDFLEPAGFAVDLYSVPHNDVSTQSFVPVQRPWVDARGDWYPLDNPALGRFRVSQQGTVFNYSTGLNGVGYAVCLHCGRAEPMPVDGSLPEVFQDHKTGQHKEHRRLRGAQGGDSAVCSGSHSSFAIRPNLRLGSESSTDVLEILLCGLDGAPLNDVQVAYSIAVAMRTAVAGMIGVEIDEIGCETKPVQVSGGKTGQAIVLFDHAASGYCSSIAGRLKAVISRARTVLFCEAECDDACQNCLLQYDTRFRLDDLDRHAALTFINDRWISELGVPDEYAYFGANSRVEWQSLPEAITRVLSGAKKACKLRLFLSGTASEWDFPASPIRQWVRQWSSVPIELISAEDVSKVLSSADRRAVIGLSVLEGVTLHCSAGKRDVSSGYNLLAEIQFNDGNAIVWGIRGDGKGIPDMGWGCAQEGDVLISGGCSASVESYPPMEIAELPASEYQIAKLDIAHDLDGNCQGFGVRLLEAITKATGGRFLSSDAEILKITYSDRYIKNPLSTALLVEFVSAIKKSYPDRWGTEVLQLTVIPVIPRSPSERQPFYVSDDWPITEQRNDALVAAFEYCGTRAVVDCRSKNETQHARVLDIELSNNKLVRLSLDQGFSFWRTKRTGMNANYANRFDFRANSEQQAESIANMRVDIEGSISGSYIVIEETDVGEGLADNWCREPQPQDGQFV